MYVVVATYTVKAGSEAAVAAFLRKMTPPSRAEPGCLEYRAHQSTDDPRIFVLYEGYADERAYQQHTETSHFKQWVLDGAVPLLESRERVFLETLD